MIDTCTTSDARLVCKPAGRSGQPVTRHALSGLGPNDYLHLEAGDAG